LDWIIFFGQTSWRVSYKKFCLFILISGFGLEREKNQLIVALTCLEVAV